MQLTIRLLKMTVVIGMLFLAISACQKSVPAVPLKTTSHSTSSDSTLNRDTTTTKKDSTTTKKDSTTTKKDSTTTKKDSTVTTPPPSGGTVINVGTGSGNIVIDGTGKTYACNSIIKIKAGTYSSITVKNIQNQNGCPVTITNDGLVTFTGAQSMFSNLDNVIFTGNGTSGIAKGFVFRDISYRAITLDENSAINNFTFQYVSFSNIGDYVISYQYNKAYNGSASSYSQNLKFLNIDCNNTSMLLAGSGSVQGGVKGLIKNIEIANVNFQNSPAVGTIVWLGNVEDYDIHNNTVNNINTTNNDHNGIFLICGNGKFHNNYISNHQGNSIRAWGFTIGSTPKQILIYNNIIVNSRKYSGFEVQSFDYLVVPGLSTYANAKIFNNTCGNLNLIDDWQGNVVDVYSLFGGSCDVYNNLGFNFHSSDGAKPVIAGQESILTPTQSNNLLFSTSAAAGITDESSMRLTSTSPAKGAGKYEPLATTDYYGTSRHNPPSIGAVE